MRAFYRDVLQLPEAGGWDEPGDRGVVFSCAGGEVELMEQDASALAIYPEGAGWRLALQVADVQKEYDRLESLNIPMPRPIVERSWGARDFVVQDPAGNWILIFSTHEA